MGLIQAFHLGGPFMYVILFFGVLTLGFIVERWSALYLRRAIVPLDIKSNVKQMLRRGDVAQAERLAVQSATPFGKIMAIGCAVRLSGGSDEEVQARMDEELSRQTHLIDRRTSFLAVFGNVATLLGLLGTITGMITSFAAVAKASPMDRATMLSAGIAEAMNCTAFGLIVAIPALVAYAVYQNKTDHMVQELTHSSTELFNDLIFYFGGVSSSAVKAPLSMRSEMTM